MMAVRLSCLLFLISLTESAKAQSWEFIQSHDLGQTITTADVAALGKIYLGTSRGNVYSFLADGTPDTQFSSAIFQPVTSLDASNSLKVFVYYQGIGKFEFLDRFSAMQRTYSITDFGMMSAELAMPGINNSIWFLSGGELIQVNPLIHSVILRIRINGLQLNKPNQMRLLTDGFLISDERGIHKIQMDGELQFSIEVEGIRGFIVDGDEAMSLTSKGLLIFNINTSRTEWSEPPRSDFELGFRMRAYFHFIKGSQLLSYRQKE